MDRYSELLVFTRAVAEGDFSAAARSLSLTPSAVSKLVSRLENRLGVRLFSRSSRRMALTPEGEKFYSAALRAIDAVEEADTAVAPNNLHGDTLRIRSAPTFAASHLAPLIPTFRKQHPSLRIEVHLRMEVGNPLEGGMDVAIYVGDLADSSLVARPFARTRWIICASPRYLAVHGTPRTPADLARHECLNFLPSMAASVRNRIVRLSSGAMICSENTIKAHVFRNYRPQAGSFLPHIARSGPTREHALH